MNQPSQVAGPLADEEKRRILAELLRERTRRPKRIPASFGQQRLWFIDRLEPQSAAFNMPVVLQLEGHLAVNALERALYEVVRRHEVLRTTFGMQDGQLMQVVHPFETGKLAIQDLSALPDPDRTETARRNIAAEARTPFDLEQGPLLRMRLIRLNEAEHVLSINMHHIITDGWSRDIFMREVTTLYHTYLGRPAPPLAELPIQYGDYAVWQREHLQGKTLDAELSYWRQQLGSNSSVTELPVQYHRPAMPDSRGGRQEVLLDEQLSSSLETLSRRERVTLFMTVLAGLKALLYRQTLQEEITVGTVVSGRTRPETENLIGFFNNSLVLRTAVAPSLSFREFLHRVEEVALQAFAHQEVPFEKVVEMIEPERHLGRRPLFEVMINFNPVPPQQATVAGLSMSPVDLGEPEAKHPITLYVGRLLDRISLSIVYQKALYSARRIESLLSQYVSLLQQVVVAPDEQVGRYRLREARPVASIPDPTTSIEAPAYDSVVERFNRCARGAPDQIAVTQLGRSWTYGELCGRAHAIAWLLVEGGIQPGDTVGVTGVRSFGLIASIVGVLAARGVLLLVDTNVPEVRKQQMAQQAAMRKIIWVHETGAGNSWLDSLPSVITLSVAPDTGTATESAAAGVRAGVLLVPAHSDAAYIFFTSGTTGKPKGIQCSHNGLAHFIDWESTEFRVGPGDRCAMLSGLSFEPVMRDVFLPLTNGATLCLPYRDFEARMREVPLWLDRERVSIIHLVPAIGQLFLALSDHRVSLRALRLVLFAGEPLSDSLVRRWRAAFPDSGEVANLYGPTETTLAKFFYMVPSELSPGIQPVGKPLPHTQGLVLNRHGNLCGLGEPGEIVIRTPYRSLGYIGSGAGTGQTFAANPFSNEPDDLVYFTRDIGRYRADGVLEILGRADHQVKIRGVRIELEEIEAIVSRYADVATCVAAVRQYGELDQRLIAYVVPLPGRSIPVGELRRYLKRELPKYNIPSHIVVLDELPLTANGKVNRHALPAPDMTRTEIDSVSVGPRDETERELCRIWEEILGMQPIGATDNFFELGGHSLLAIELIARIEKRFGVAVPLAALFEAGTVEHLAARLRHGPQSRGGPLVHVQPYGERRPLFFVHPAGGSALCYAPLAKRLEPEQPFYALQAIGLDGEAAPLTSIEQMAAAYIKAIKEIQSQGPYFLGGWSMGGLVAYEMACQITAAGGMVARLVLLDQRAPEAASQAEPLDDVSILRRACGDTLDIDPQALEGLSEVDRLEYLFERMQMSKLLPPEVQMRNLRNYLNLYRVNISASRNYVVRKYPGGITLFKTEGAGEDPTLGWRDFATGGVQVRPALGRHADMVFEPHVASLAAGLSEFLST